MVDLPPDGLTGPAFSVDDWVKEFLSHTPKSGAPEAAIPYDEPPDSKTGAPVKTDDLEQQEVENHKHNRGLRGIYADKAHQLAIGCISIWTIMLGAQGVVKAATGIEMWSDKVLIAVTTGVTVSVLAAFLGVIRGLFGPLGGGRNSK